MKGYARPFFPETESREDTFKPNEKEKEAVKVSSSEGRLTGEAVKISSSEGRTTGGAVKISSPPLKPLPQKDGLELLSIPARYDCCLLMFLQKIKIVSKKP